MRYNRAETVAEAGRILRLAWPMLLLIVLYLATLARTLYRRLMEESAGSLMLTSQATWGMIAFATFAAMLCMGGVYAAWLHLPAAAWGAWIEFADRVCPLTPLENWLRVRAGGAGYSGGFVEHYILPLLYPGRLTDAVSERAD